MELFTFCGFLLNSWQENIYTFANGLSSAFPEEVGACDLWPLESWRSCPTTLWRQAGQRPIRLVVGCCGSLGVGCPANINEMTHSVMQIKWSWWGRMIWYFDFQSHVDIPLGSSTMWDDRCGFELLKSFKKCPVKKPSPIKSVELPEHECWMSRTSQGGPNIPKMSEGAPVHSLSAVGLVSWIGNN